MRPWCDAHRARQPKAVAAAALIKNCNWCLSHSLSFAAQAHYEHGTQWAMHTLCARVCFSVCVCVTERFSIVHKKCLNLYGLVKETSMWRRLITCVILHGMLPFFVFSFTAFALELTMNDNNVNDTHLSCHICIFRYAFLCTNIRIVGISCLCAYNCHQWALWYFIHFWIISLSFLFSPKLS